MLNGSRFIFVGGLHRSGTTPLTRVLAQSEQIAGLTGTGVSEDEGQHLQDVYPKIRAFGGMGRFANDLEAHLTEESPLATADNARRLVDAWSPYWDLEAPYLLEKSPSNMIMGRFLQATFPGSALIVVVRHPVAVALAMQKWNPRLFARNGRRRVSLVGLVAHWVRAHELLLEDAPHLPRLLVLRYEDLVERPEPELESIRAFLGLEDRLPADSVRRGLSDVYLQQWRAMASGGPLERRRRRVIERRFGTAVARFGYDLSTGEHGPAALSVLPSQH